VTFRERSYKYEAKFITVTILKEYIQLPINALIFHLNYQDIAAIAVAIAMVVVELVVVWW
jgi:hypothetical protein